MPHQVAASVITSNATNGNRAAISAESQPGAARTASAPSQ